MEINFHDAQQALDSALNLFSLGYLTLEQRAQAEQAAAGRELTARALRDTGAFPSGRKIDPAPLDPATQTSLAVVKSAFSVALDGFALPYGDVAVGGWRNTPYVVIQNVGAYLDTPRFLDGDHPVRDATDAEAYLSRLAAMPAQLDGELERLGEAGASPFRRIIAPGHDKDDSRLLAALGRLAEIDPALGLGSDEGSGRPVLAMWNAFFSTSGISSGRRTEKLCFTTGRQMPIMSVS